MTDEKYYSIPIIRFYIRCSCFAEIAFKTDPRNMGRHLNDDSGLYVSWANLPRYPDYTCEHGAKRNF